MASPEALPITLEAPSGGAPLRLAWGRGEARSRPRQAEGAGGSAWRVDGEIDWDAVEALRLISAVFEDGHALALATLRPRGATGHDRDQVAHHLERSGEPVALSEALLSTEYDAGGLPRRIGIELWAEPGSPPLRVVGDRHGEIEVRDDDEVRREVAQMSFRLDGAGGQGTYELLRPA